MRETAGLLHRILLDQRRRWCESRPISVQALLKENPALRADPDAVVELIWNEVLLREEQGDKPGLDEYLEQFREYETQLRALFQGSRTQADQAGERRWAACAAPIGAEAPANFPVVPGYEILAELGRGGMGVVYQSRHSVLKRIVALKMILAGPHADARLRARFRTEAEAVARLQHPNIVQIHEVGEHDGRPFLALEFVDGGSLEEKMGDTPQSERDAAQIVETVARAIDYVHQRGILHRDLKPNNILLTRAGIPKIADFGLAKLLDAEESLTRTKAILGTPNYISPEQAAGHTKSIGPPADIYALGTILYELLTGRPPFGGTTVLDTLEQVRTQAPISPRRLRGNISRDLETICLKCLEKEPKNRYASAAALADDLRRFLQSQPIQARPISPGRHLWRFARRRPTLIAVVFAAVALTFGAWISVSHFRASSELNRHRAAEKYQDFLRLRDDAFFHGLLSPDEGALFLGDEAAANLQAAEASARAALSLAGVDPALKNARPATTFPESQRAETLADSYSLLLVLASLRGQQGGNARSEEALQILTRAGQLGFRTKALHIRRAYFWRNWASPTRPPRNARERPPRPRRERWIIS